MRHFLLALMIALLPLRAWLGDSMALAAWNSGITSPVAQADAHPGPTPSALAPGEAPSTHAHSLGQHPAGGPAAAEAADTMAALGAELGAALEAEATENGATHTHSGDMADASAMADCRGPGGSEGTAHGHSLCDLCNGPALVQPTAAIAGTVARDRLLVARHERFLSAEPQPGQKPPIA